MLPPWAHLHAEQAGSAALRRLPLREKRRHLLADAGKAQLKLQLPLDYLRGEKCSTWNCGVQHVILCICQNL